MSKTFDTYDILTADARDAAYRQLRVLDEEREEEERWQRRLIYRAGRSVRSSVERRWGYDR